jgi:hypothetical protein
MSLKPIYWDDVAQRVKRGETAEGFSYADYFAVSSGQTEFEVEDEGAVTGLVRIDVWQNGLLEVEGDGADEWGRDVDNNSIVFNSAVPNNAEIRIRIYG